MFAPPSARLRRTPDVPYRAAMLARNAFCFILLVLSVACATAPPATAPVATGGNSIVAAALDEPGAGTPNITTEEMEAAIASGTVLVLDTRPHLEWAISHIPGALNVSPKPGTSMSLYISDVAEIERLARGDKQKSLIVYCNGPFCGKARRVADELLEAGFTSVRRYQLGAPVWRALGKLMVIEPEAVPYVLRDSTAFLIDAREAAAFARGSVAQAKNIPQAIISGGKDSPEIKAAKDDGRLPMHDHNTRIVVFGRDGAQARALAESITREAFHNVAYFDGTFEEFARAARQ